MESQLEASAKTASCLSLELSRVQEEGERLRTQVTRTEEALAATQALLDASHSAVLELSESNAQYNSDADRARAEIETLQSDMREAARYHEEVLANAMKQQVN